MGVRYSDTDKKFEFNFEHDGQTDIISLTGHGFQVEAFGKCFYYGYEFADDVDSNVRSSFINHLKFRASLKDEPNLTHFIQKSINDLHSEINLYNFDLVVMPQSSSQVNQYMLRYIYRFAQPSLYYMELIKSLPQEITFDMEGYRRQYLDATLENGKPRYTEAQKQQVEDTINQMLDLIHKKDYFSIAKDVKKSKMRPYITRFLKFKDEKDEELCGKVRKQNILVVDDITTSGSTLNEILRTLRILNDDNEITVFSLIGRKDLMIESI